jgi:hypothetical protein
MMSKFNRVIPEIRFTHLEWLDYSQHNMRSDFETIAVAELFDGLLSTMYCMTTQKPISTDMEDWIEQEKAYHIILKHMLTMQEYSAMLTYIETLKGE